MKQGYGAQQNRDFGVQFAVREIRCSLPIFENLITIRNDFVEVVASDYTAVPFGQSGQRPVMPVARKFQGVVCFSAGRKESCPKVQADFCCWKWLSQQHIEVKRATRFQFHSNT